MAFIGCKKQLLARASTRTKIHQYHFNDLILFNQVNCYYDKTQVNDFMHVAIDNMHLNDPFENYVIYLYDEPKQKVVYCCFV